MALPAGHLADDLLGDLSAIEHVEWNPGWRPIWRAQPYRPQAFGEGFEASDSPFGIEIRSTTDDAGRSDPEDQSVALRIATAWRTAQPCSCRVRPWQ